MVVLSYTFFVFSSMDILYFRLAINFSLAIIIWCIILQVRLIDVGSVRIVDVNQLLVLPDQFLKIPAQVFEVFLCGVVPRDNDRDWSEEVLHVDSEIHCIV